MPVRQSMTALTSLSRSGLTVCSVRFLALCGGRNWNRTISSMPPGFGVSFAPACRAAHLAACVQPPRFLLAPIVTMRPVRREIKLLVEPLVAALPSTVNSNIDRLDAPKQPLDQYVEEAAIDEGVPPVWDVQPGAPHPVCQRLAPFDGSHRSATLASDSAALAAALRLAFWCRRQRTFHSSALSTVQRPPSSLNSFFAGNSACSPQASCPSITGSKHHGAPSHSRCPIWHLLRELDVVLRGEDRQAIEIVPKIVIAHARHARA